MYVLRTRTHTPASTQYHVEVVCHLQAPGAARGEHGLAILLHVSIFGCARGLGPWNRRPCSSVNQSKLSSCPTKGLLLQASPGREMPAPVVAPSNLSTSANHALSALNCMHGESTYHSMCAQGRINACTQWVIHDLCAVHCS